VPLEYYCRTIPKFGDKFLPGQRQCRITLRDINTLLQTPSIAQHDLDDVGTYGIPVRMLLIGMDQTDLL
jgi:hypothetical protein